MKDMRKSLVTGMVSLLFAISCNDNFLNTMPQDSVSSELTWADGALSEAFVFGVYSALGYAGFEEEGLSSLTDEALFTHSGRGINTITEGTVTPSNLGNTNIIPNWDELYEAIRNANIALEQLPESTFENDELRERLLGESHFLRAYFYHQLLRHFGGVPIIEKPYGLEDDFSIARNTYEETVNFIVSDLETAAGFLEGKGEIAGRAGQLAALALKSRVLLYAASDLHDGPTATTNSSVIASYPNLELIAYTSGDRASRWQAAKVAAKTVLDMATGYKLDLSAPVTAEEGTSNYLALSMGGGSNVADPSGAQDLIWERTHTGLYTEESNWPLGGIHVGQNNGPNGYHNWSGNTPIQQLVDDYEMMDGSKFDWNDPSHAGDPYTNRDPRLYATVLYDGADWKPRPSDVVSFDQVNQIQTGLYADGNGGIIAGVDTRQGPVEDWNGSRTGYYMRKFIDPDPAKPDNTSTAQVVPWPFIRYTEVVLNYAEACIETGDEAEAITWLNKIRFRAGMPAITDIGTALKDRYRNERRIELVNEEHRYFDVRRWMIGPTTIGRNPKLIQISATVKPGQTPHVPYRHDKDVYDYQYVPIENTDNEVRTWVDKMYYRVISRDEINRNELLVQNPGY